MFVKRFHMEVVTAAVTGAVGLAAVTGSLELGMRWTDHGPEAGYFPFYVGLILIAASLWNAGRAILSHRRHGIVGDESFLDRDQARRLAGFILPMLAFVIVTVVMGLYVGTALYLFYVAWRQGKYHPLASLGLGAGFAIALYVIFEVLFLVPLLKGPIEPLFGIY